MRTKIQFLLFTIVFGCISMGAQQSEDTKQIPSTQSVIITIKGMACQEGCADTIATNLKNIEGVVSADVSYESGLADIEFNEDSVSIDSLKSVITSTKVKDYIYTIEQVMLVENEAKLGPN